MGFLSFIGLQRASAHVTFNDLYPVDKATSNQVVDETTAITLSAVSACVKVLSETPASLPLNVYEVKNGKTSITHNNPISFLVEKSPNEIMTRITFIQTLMASVVYEGKFFALIHRNVNSTPTWLQIIPNDDVKILKNKAQSKIFYEINNEQYNQKRVDSMDMIHIIGLSFDGVNGLSPISYARETFGIGLAEQEFQGKFLSNGATLAGVLTQPGKVNEEQMKRLKKSWNAEYGGSGNTGKTAVLENGMEFKPIGIKPIDAQFLESRKFSTEEIARIFNVPLHMIGELTRSTNNNIEQQALEFVVFTIRPWLKKIEAEFNKKLLTTEEWKTGSSFIRFNVNSLLRGDVKTRMELYKTMNLIGAMNADEIRELEDLNGYEGGDTYFVQANMIPVDRAIKGETNIEDNGE